MEGVEVVDLLARIEEDWRFLASNAIRMLCSAREITQISEGNGLCGLMRVVSNLVTPSKRLERTNEDLDG